ncbi:hypothetical protein PV08_07301 [Exophiala spinifera]|uniref:Uncharacterized protein n=1 Tax=Exophiala spinifera TaxID=91928 RepID=A0A0D1ZP22_9EURO|nr:uncharacterized protein PV08_07301 [Exophiala spinifera]KIW14517.1 hypothetical protein PV08_07301 [Exophiala spinifera]
MKLMTRAILSILFALALAVAAIPTPDDAVGAEVSPSIDAYDAAYASSAYSDADGDTDNDTDTETASDTTAASARISANVTSSISPPTTSASAPASMPPYTSYEGMFKNKVIIVNDATFLHALEYAASHPAALAADDSADDNPNEKRDNGLQPKEGKLPTNKKPKMVKWCTPQMDYCTSWYAPYSYYGDNDKRDVERRAHIDWPDNLRVWCSKHGGMCVHMNERVY